VCIVMDPRNGEILAMVSKPDYDLNQPFAAPAGIEGIDPATWDGTSNDAVKILNKTVWRNKAISDTYEPGSTFKTFTAAAGLEEGVVTPDTVTNDSPVDVSGWTINCWRKGKPLHGTETFRQAVYNSCNPVFVKVAQGLGTARFYRYLRAFGFFDKTDIGLYGESTPVFQENPAEIDMATASFGQRFTITPIQLITGYTAIVNDGNLIKPRLVMELTDSDGSVVEKFEPEVVRSVISAKTSKTIKSILEGVVSAPGATGANAYVKGYRIAGKTGTAETTKKGVYTASFCGFAPANDPIISVLVVLFEPTGEQYMGGQIAAPTAGKIFEAVLDYMKVERNYTEDDLKNIKKEVYIPDVRKKTIADAAAALKSAGLGCRIEGEGVSTGLVVQQNPVQFTSVPKESVVTLYTYKPEQEVMATVPDLSEKTLSEAEEALKAVGLNIRVSGSGMVSGQSVAAGSKLAKGTVINVEFKQVDNIE
ncbi:MAG: PASTA domain-containing protein, partial [Clostridiales bacterium]|nr:PASTA domain-containing protein [Clostridiales bacterium]